MCLTNLREAFPINKQQNYGKKASCKFLKLGIYFEAE